MLLNFLGSTIYNKSHLEVPSGFGLKKWKKVSYYAIMFYLKMSTIVENFT